MIKTTKPPRFYEALYPKIDEVVMVKVKSIEENYVKVSLLEYENITGMIRISEILTKRERKSPQKLIKIGQRYPVTVLQVDEGEKFIDLSKLRISADEAKKCQEQYKKSKFVFSVMLGLCLDKGYELEELYSTVVRPLAKIYGHAFEAFNEMNKKPDKDLFDSAERPAEAVLNSLKERLHASARELKVRKVRPKLQMTCFNEKGVLAIQEAMRAAESLSTNDVNVKLTIDVAPQYIMEVITEKETGPMIIACARKACAYAREIIESHGGQIQVNEEPHFLSTNDNARARCAC